MKDKIIKLLTPYWEEMHFSKPQRDIFIDLFIRNKPRYILETGFATGTSALTMCYASLVSNDSGACPLQAISVALQEGEYKALGVRAQKHLEHNFNFKLIEGHSANILNENFFNKNYPKGIDYFFVDGGHSYSDFFYDMKAGAPAVNKGGIMVIDDYFSEVCPMPQVNEAVDNFYSSHEREWQKDFIRCEDGKGLCILMKNKNI